MIKLSFQSDGKNHVILNITPQHLERMRQDNPIVADLKDLQLPRNVIVIYLSPPDGRMTPGLEKVVDQYKYLPFKTMICAIGLDNEDTQRISDQKSFMKFNPGENLPQIEEIVIFCVESEEKLEAELRGSGLVSDKTDIRRIPRGGIRSN